MKIYALLIMIAGFLTLASGVPALAQNEEHVKFATDIEYIRGHLQQAIANKQSNNVTLAQAHASHPISEVYSFIEEEIEERNATLNMQLKSSLTELTAEIESLSTAEFEQKVAGINAMLDMTRELVLSSSEQSDGTFNAIVISSLLETAVREYEEAVMSGKIVEIVEYQDASAFIERAKVNFESIRTQVPDHEAGEIDEFFDDLNGNVASVAEVGEVRTTVGGIVNELDEVFNLGGVDGLVTDGHAYLDKIQLLLNQTLQKYEAGEYQEARKLAVEAYIDNYEYIEKDIEADDAQLMKKIEIALRNELVDMIDERRPVSEIESRISTISADLEEARAIVIPEFPLATGAALAFAAATILVGTFFARRRLTYSRF